MKTVIHKPLRDVLYLDIRRILERPQVEDALVRDEPFLPSIKDGVVRLQPSLKNRIHALLGRRHLEQPKRTDLFGSPGRAVFTWGL